jgi:hypothetical protein
MARKIGTAAISTGEYEKDGQQKKKWLNIGAVFEDEKGNVSIKFEVLPVPTPQKDGYPAAWVKIFLDDNNKQGSPPPAYKTPTPQKPASPPVSQYSEADYPDAFPVDLEDDGQIPF